MNGTNRMAASIVIASTLALAGTASAKTTLTLFYWNTGQQDRDYFTRVIKDFEKANPDLKVKVMAHPWVGEADYATKLLTMVAGDMAPDVIAMPFTLLPRMADKGIIADIGPFLANDKSVKLDDWMPVGQTAVKWNRKTWGLPWQGSSWWVNYNRKLVAEAGLPDLEKLATQGDWNWEALVNAMTKLTKTGANGKVSQYGAASFGGYQPVVPWIRGMGGDIMDDSFKPTLTKEGTIKGIEYVNSLINTKRVYTTGIDAQGQFATNKLGMMLWWDSISSFLLMTSKGKVSLNQVPFPAGPVNAKDINAQYHSFTMSRQGKHRAKSWTLMKYLTGREAVAQMADTLKYFEPRYDTVDTYRRNWLSDGITGTPNLLMDAMKRTDVETRYTNYTLAYIKIDEMLDRVWKMRMSPAAAMAEAQRYVSSVIRIK